MGEQEPKRVKKHICAGILAHVDAGKTTLSEGLLYCSGSIRKLGRVDNRDAFLDTYELERARGITIFSKQAVLSLKHTQITLIDTPGHVDFSAEMERTLQVLDYAILVISGPDGVQGHTETLWRLLKRCQIPVFLFVNKMDQEGTDKTEILKELREKLGDHFVDFGVGGEEFYENLAFCEEQLLEDFLEQGTIEQDQIIKLICERKVFPCYFGSALRLEGVDSLLEGLELYTRTPRAKGEFGARIFKISRDSQGNRLTHMKITGGRLRVKEILPGGKEDKINQIRVYSGSRYETVQEAEAGMICAVTGPKATAVGQGIGAEEGRETSVLEPVLSCRIYGPAGCDMHKLLKDLRQLEEEEPHLHLSWNENLGEIHAQVMGEMQIEILERLIEERFGIKVKFGSGRILYKETILEPVEGVGHFEPLRHYAEVHLLMEPGAAGSGLQFEAHVSEDELAGNWQRLILSQLEEKRHIGVLTGSELTDIKITLTAGRAHLKHTEGGDFYQAANRAVRQGLMEGKTRLLEPVYSFRLELPKEYLGRAMADLERMHGSFGLPRQEGESSILMGSAPAADIKDYQREVISYTKGCGRLWLSLKGYEPCHNEAEVIEAIGYDPDRDIENPSWSVFCSHGAGYQVPWDQVKSHMHLESTLANKQEESREANLKKREPDKRQDSWAEEKELEAIFNHVYKGGKRQKQEQSRPRRTLFSQENRGEGEWKGTKKEKKQESEEYLLVDGYNIIFAWPELRELSRVTIDGARHKLMDILCNYQGYKKCRLIVVFDAYNVSGNTGQALDYHNIHVVYTKEAETADQYIEKLAHQMGRKHQVTVATSDGLEQLIIYGQGCLLLSAAELKEEIERTNKLIREERERHKRQGKNYLFRDVDQELSDYLERIRLGKDR